MLKTALMVAYPQKACLRSRLVARLPYPSPDLHPAIDHDIDARHVRTLVRGQEQRDVRHLLWSAETPKQGLAEHRARPFGILKLFSRLIGFDQARGDGIRANTVFSPLHRELPRHADDPCLGRRMRQGGKRLEAQ